MTITKKHFYQFTVTNNTFQVGTICCSWLFNMWHKIFIRYRKWTYLSCPNTPSTTTYKELFLTQNWVLGVGLHRLLASKLCLLFVVHICIDTCVHCTVGGIISHFAAKQLWMCSAFSWTRCIVQNILWWRYLSQTMW